MDALQAILTRRSIRRYTSEPVSDETVTELLKAAMSAPTAAGEIWDFVVVRDRNVLAGVSKYHPHAEMLKSANVAILVCGNPNIEKLPGRWVLDCAAATENILIAANALGLGAVWVGIYPVEERIKGLRVSSWNTRLHYAFVHGISWTPRRKEVPTGTIQKGTHSSRSVVKLYGLATLRKSVPSSTLPHSIIAASQRL